MPSPQRSPYGQFDISISLMHASGMSPIVSRTAPVYATPTHRCPKICQRSMQMANASTPAVRPAVSMLNLRWFQLLIGILGMVAIANLQYGWTMFVDPINEKFKFGRVGIQFA